jgi:hypothetical protein
MHVSLTTALRTGAAALALTVAASGIAGAQSTVLAKHGAEIDARVRTPISTKTSKNGDPFTLTVTDTLFVHHSELKGAKINGHLEDITPAGPTHKASMHVIFDDITFPDGRSEPISVAVKNMGALEPKTHHIRDMGIIVGSAVVGHITSKKTGHGGGTLAGAAAGFALVSAMKSDITIKPGTLVKLRLQQDLQQPA